MDDIPREIYLWMHTKQKVASNENQIKFSVDLFLNWKYTFLLCMKLEFYG